MAMSKRDYEILAAELCDDAYRQMNDAAHDRIDAATVMHYRYVIVVALACRRINERFNARVFIEASVPESWRNSIMTLHAIDAIEAKSMRVWDEAVATRA